MMEIRVEEDNVIELHDASAKGCTVTLNRLIHKDPHILNKISLTSFNETPLHISALLGHVDFTKDLLALRPQLALDLDFQKRCPLHLASANGHIEIVHALLRANDDACLVCDQDGRIPLHYAVMRGKDEVVKELILAKPDSIRDVFNGGETVLHLCVKYNQLETLKLLVEAVSDDEEFLNSKDHDGGNTILHLAVILKQIEAVKYLLSISKVKERADALNWMGFTALDVLKHSPKDFKSFTIQNILLDADIERAKNQNNPPPLSATTIGYQESAKPTRSRKRRWSKWLECLKYKSNWLEEMRGALMVVATVITTITFQSAVDPPDGVSKIGTNYIIGDFACVSSKYYNDTSLPKNTSVVPGIHKNLPLLPKNTSVLPCIQKNLPLYFLISNSIAFTASLSVTFLFISGFPLKNRVFMVLLTLGMWSTLTFLCITYVITFALVIPEPLFETLNFMILIPIGVLFVLIIFVLLYHTIRFLTWLIWKISKFIFTCALGCWRNHN